MAIDLVQLGSKTAKGGFKNEDDVIDRFNNWKQDIFAQEWLKIMGYDLEDIESVQAIKISKQKTDVQVQISLKSKKIINQNLQVKLVSGPRGFNQIDKRWISNYVEMWGIEDDVIKLLQYFTGELLPCIKNSKSPKRMFVSEFSDKDREKLFDFFRKNKSRIISNIFRGQGELSAEWMLVILKNGTTQWALKPMSFVLNFYDGEVSMTQRGSICMGKITIQRKGGDNGRDTAKMLQFKINPALIVE